MAISFTRKTNWLWQNAEKILIIIFLLTFNFSIRKVFLTPYSFLNGAFNEYLTVSVSWADVLMIAVILIYTIKAILEQVYSRPSLNNTSSNNKTTLSMFSLLKSVSRETILLALFLLWAGLSIFWSQYKPIAFYRFIIFVEIATFILIAVKSFAYQKWLRLALLVLIINGLFQSILAIAQFIHNRSLGFRFLGESIFTSNMDGVAKIIINGDKHIRAYGTFPHPNILAGFLLIPIFITLSELLKRSEYAKDGNEKVSRGTLFRFFPRWLVTISLFMLISGFLSTFSRSAFLGFIFGLLALGFIHRKIMSRNFFHIIFFCLILIILGISFSIHLNKNLISIFSTQSLEERNLYQNVARETISEHSFSGIGIGQFVIFEYFKNPNSSGWQYQPVHNVYLLIFSELGVIGLILFLFFLMSIFKWSAGEKRISKNGLTYYSFYCIVFSFLFIFLFDHYFWDIKLGIITFILPILLLKTANYE
jgi:O-antigen ligase